MKIFTTRYFRGIFFISDYYVIYFIENELENAARCPPHRGYANIYTYKKKRVYAVNKVKWWHPVGI